MKRNKSVEFLLQPMNEGKQRLSEDILDLQNNVNGAQTYYIHFEKTNCY